MKRAIVTVGLGFGDEGKGATVDHLCREYNADLVVRYCGGSQAGHNVQLPDGRRHTFSQFGAGTLTGARTYLGPRMVIHPAALLREADHLRTLNIAAPFDTLTVHPACLVSTYLHQATNQIRELARAEPPLEQAPCEHSRSLRGAGVSGDRWMGRHGSCGHGIGETRSYWLRYGDDAVLARDLTDRGILREKLERLRQRLLLDLQPVIDHVSPDVLREYDLLSLTPEAVAESLLEVGGLLHIGEMPEHTTAIYEGAQGVLLDEWYGFHPYTTWSTVTPHHALELVVQSGAEELCVLGLTRAYATRHGAGPFPTQDESLTARIRDEGNPWNTWQGNLRSGWLDLVLLRYAVAACGSLDGLVVSCLDQAAEEARVCVAYENCKELPLPAGPSLAHQERLTRLLETAVPVCVPAKEKSLLEMLEEVAPVALRARGPTHRDRENRGLRFRRRVVRE
jgi:adenylosuccinate synthase